MVAVISPPEVSNDYIIDLVRGHWPCSSWCWLLAGFPRQDCADARRSRCISTRPTSTSIQDAAVLFRFSVTRWSTPAERTDADQTLFKKGQDALLDTLRDMRSVGRIHTPGNIGYDLRYAEQRRAARRRREIILATDRPMSFWEIVNRPLSSEYPFTWVQFKIRPDGTGEGKIAVARAIVGEEADDSIESPDFAISPVRLQNIRSRKGAN